jgi:diguanylate cyclase (GGDEF)-like protein/PAS domain S-box-containing protein
MEASLGHSSTALVGRHISMVVNPLDIHAIEAVFEKIAVYRLAASGLEFRIRHVDGYWHWHENNVAPIVGLKDELKGFLGIGRNVEARKHTESKLHHLAHTDDLTGIANRYAIIEQLKRELQQARSAQRKLAVMFIDLDGFKLINDTFGHDAGDTVLQHFASSLKVATRGGSDHVGRLAGDEFLVILPDLPDRKTAEHAARRIQDLLKVPFVVDGTQIVVLVSQSFLKMEMISTS